VTNNGTNALNISGYIKKSRRSAGFFLRNVYRNIMHQWAAADGLDGADEAMRNMLSLYQCFAPT
jgi:hypothetical protein